MTYECLLYEVKDGVATLTLNRPDRLNALGGSLRDDLHDAITRSSADSEVRVMVITGSGKGFCAGGDVKDFADNPDRIGILVKELTTYLHGAVSRLASGSAIQSWAPCSTVVSGVETSEWLMPWPAVIRLSSPGRTIAWLPAESRCSISPSKSQLAVCSPVCGCGATTIPPVWSTSSGP